MWRQIILAAATFINLAFYSKVYVWVLMLAFIYKYGYEETHMYIYINIHGNIEPNYLRRRRASQTLRC